METAVQTKSVSAFLLKNILHTLTTVFMLAANAYYPLSGQPWPRGMGTFNSTLSGTEGRIDWFFLSVALVFLASLIHKYRVFRRADQSRSDNPSRPP